MEVKILQYETYLETIKKSIGSNLFQTVWAKVNGEKKDITNQGQYSCALHVSRILHWFDLVKELHTMTPGLRRDMEGSEWTITQELKPGCVIFWGREYRRGTENEHIGFYIGDEKAICADADKGVPVERYYAYKKIDSIYWHPKLDEWMKY